MQKKKLKKLKPLVIKLYGDGGITPGEEPKLPSAKPGPKQVVPKMWMYNGKYYKSETGPQGNITGNVLETTPEEFNFYKTQSTGQLKESVGETGGTPGSSVGASFITFDPTIPYVPKDTVNYTPRFEFGGLFDNRTLDFSKSKQRKDERQAAGNAWADVGMGAANVLGVGLEPITGKSFSDTVGYDYNTQGGQDFNKLVNKRAAFSKQIAPTIAGIAGTMAGVPGAGQAVSALQQGYSQIDTQPQDGLEASGYMAQGGGVQTNTVNVERNELEVDKKGKIVKDFKKKPSHPSDGSINMYGNVEAGVGNMIIPADQRSKYLEGDKLTKSTIMSNVRKAQLQREKDLKEVTEAFGKGGAYIKRDVYGKGGEIHIKPSHVGLFTEAAERAGMKVQEYAHHVMSNSDNSVLRKRAQFAINASQWNHKADNGMLIEPEPQIRYQQQAGRDANNPFPQAYGNTISGVSGPSSSQPFWQGASNVPWGDIVGQAATYAPTAYNIGMGLLSKPEQYNTQEYMSKADIPYRDVDMTPIQNRIRQERQIALRNAQSASGGGAGQYLSNAAQIGANTATALSEAEMQAQQYNNQNRFGVDQTNLGTDQANKRFKMMINESNAQNRAKKSEFLGKGLEGLQQGVQTNRYMKNQKNMDTIKVNVLNDILSNYGYEGLQQYMKDGIITDQTGRVIFKG